MLTQYNNFPSLRGSWVRNDARVVWIRNDIYELTEDSTWNPKQE